MMNESGASFLMLVMILFPALCGGLSLLVPAKRNGGRPAMLLLGAGGNLALAALLCGRELVFVRAWAGFGLEFSLRMYHFSGFIVFCAAVLTLLVSVYTVVFAKGKGYGKLLYAGMLFTLALVNGAVLANNLAVMLFFWEGILGTLFMMTMAGGPKAYQTSVKAVVIAGITDLCMMLGIGITAYLSQTLTMDKIRLPLTGWGMVAFVLLLIGAVSKAGSMPFHTWIPDAADDAPTPFMPFMPGALEKLLGIYLLCRLCLDLFEFEPGTAISYLLMTLGAGTILFAVMMALIQRDFKRLLSYHAVSQVGYMILGIGTALPVGIVGGLFHMLNNAVYKCGLFLVAGAVEQQTGTTNLNRLGGLGKKMPVTCACFLVLAAAIAGFPLTNGFFSKELIFDGAIESHLFFYIIAAIGAFFTPISFLKLGHAAFFGKPTEAGKNAREVHFAMLLPMVVLAAACLGLGFGQGYVVEHVLTPILGEHGGHVGGHTNWLLVGISAGLLLLAVWDHFWQFKKTGKGIETADHFHHAPGLREIYDLAEAKRFDPYEQSRGWMRAVSLFCLAVNDRISQVYDVWIPHGVGWLSGCVQKAHNGNQARYVLWIFGGLAAVALLFIWR